MKPAWSSHSISTRSATSSTWLRAGQPQGRQPGGGGVRMTRLRVIPNRATWRARSWRIRTPPPETNPSATVSGAGVGTTRGAARRWTIRPKPRLLIAAAARSIASNVSRARDEPMLQLAGSRRDPSASSPDESGVPWAGLATGTSAGTRVTRWPRRCETFGQGAGQTLPTSAIRTSRARLFTDERPRRVARPAWKPDGWRRR